MENKGFSLIVGFSVVLHAVVLYAWTGPSFKPPVVDPVSYTHLTLPTKA